MTHTVDTRSSIPQCPTCDARGRKVGAITISNQLLPTRLGTLPSTGGWRLCTTSHCDVVYFKNADTIAAQDVCALPFHKSEDASRLVCFCFNHSVAEVTTDVQQHGTSTIQAAIKTACKEGQSDCERMNPEGRCCLGNIGQVIKQAGADFAPMDQSHPTGCCQPPTTTEPV